MILPRWVHQNGYMSASIVPEAIWGTRSNSSNWTCSQTARVVRSGGQSVQDAVIGIGLHPVGVDSAAGLEEHKHGPRLPGHDSAEATKDRGGDLEQDPPDSFPVILSLPVSDPVQDRGGAPRTGLTWTCCNLHNLTADSPGIRTVCTDRNRQTGRHSHPKGGFQPLADTIFRDLVASL